MNTNFSEATKLIELLNSISEINQKLDRLSLNQKVIEGWVKRRVIMDFLDYGPTQMISFERNNNLIVSKIGKRKFVNVESLKKILEENIQF